MSDQPATKDAIMMFPATTGTVQKESQASKVGIVLTQKKKTAPLLIKTIREEGLLAATNLKPGMWVLSVNGESVYGKSAKQVATILKEAEGEVSVTAVDGDATTISKPSKDASVGISLKKNMATGAIYISKITEEGLFQSHSEALEGKVVVAVNGVAATTTKEAITIIKEAESQITLVTREAEEMDSPVTNAAPEEGSVGDDKSAGSEETDKDAGEEKKEDVEEEGEGEKGSFVDNVCGACL